MRDLMNLVEQFSTDNRKQVIVEGLREYLQMFNISPEVEATAKKHVKAIMDGLKRNDRIVWFLRYYRLSVVGYWVKKGKLQLTDQQKDKLAASVGEARFEEAVRQGEEVYREFETYKHYVGLKNATIDRVVWDRQKPEDLLYQLYQIEEKWKESLKNSINHDDEEYEMILDLGGGWAWFNLHKDYCSLEASAMGHCGNGAGKSSDTILSLRKRIDGNRWTPRATFILDKDTGILGEMKGRFNEKPDPKYHPFIVELLKHDIIQGVKGGGYLPQNNFAMNDLDPDVADELKRTKPSLRTAEDMYQEWEEMRNSGEIDEGFKDAFTAKIEQDLDGRGFKYYMVDLDAGQYGEIIVTRTPENTFFRNYDPTDRCYDLLEDGSGLEDLINQFASDLDTRTVYEVAEEVSTKYYTNVMNLLLQVYERSYRFYEMQLAWDKNNHIITEFVSVRSYLWGDEEYLEGIQELDELEDYFDSDMYQNIADEETTDDIEKDLFMYCLDPKSMGGQDNKDAVPARDLVAAILKEYVDENGESKSKNGSRTVKDPNQLDFGF